MATAATIARAIMDGADRLAGIADKPRQEARSLLAHALGVNQNDLIRDPDRVIDVSLFESYLARRVAHEPLALIVGHREFWSLDFLVSSETLIPRPDSETVVEAAIASFADRPPPRRILDLGTGTGCLLLALLHEFPAAFGVGIDIAPGAAALARINARRLGLINRAAFAAGNWTDSLAGRFDLIVSNPPYIATADIPDLMREVVAYEPHAALDGGHDGIDAYRAIIPNLNRHLDRNGAAVLELGLGEAISVSEVARVSGFETSVRLDLAEIPRAIRLKWPNC